MERRTRLTSELIDEGRVERGERTFGLVRHRHRSTVHFDILERPTIRVLDGLMSQYHFKGVANE
jgi:hypothetical protein